MHCPIYLNSCQLWCALCKQMGWILISFTVQMHPMFQWMCKLRNIWVTPNLWHLCPFGCMPQISDTLSDIHTPKSALFYSTGVPPYVADAQYYILPLSSIFNFFSSWCSSLLALVAQFFKFIKTARRTTQNTTPPWAHYLKLQSAERHNRAESSQLKAIIAPELTSWALLARRPLFERHVWERSLWAKLH